MPAPPPDGLEKQVAFIPFGKGPAEGFDDASVPEDRVTSLLDASIDKMGAYSTRLGYAAEGMNVFVPGSLGASVGFLRRMPVRNSEDRTLVDEKYLWSRYADAWHRKGNAPECSIDRLPIQGDMGQNSGFAEVCVANDLAVTTWLRLTDLGLADGLMASVTDLATGATVLGPLLLDGAGRTRPTAVRIGSAVFVSYVTSAGSVYVAKLDCTPAGLAFGWIFSAALDFAAAISAADSTADLAFLYIAHTPGVGGVTLQKLTPALVVVDTTVYLAGTGSHSIDAGGVDLALATAAGLEFRSKAALAVTTFGPTVLPGAPTRPLVVMQTPALYQVFWDVFTGSLPGLHTLNWQAYTSAAVVESIVHTTAGAALWVRPAYQASTERMYVAVTQNLRQARGQINLCSIDVTAIARASPDNHLRAMATLGFGEKPGIISPLVGLPNGCVNGDWFVPSHLAINQDLQYPRAQQVVWRVQFSSPRTALWCQAGDAVLMGSCIPTLYDGTDCFEAGFPVIPQAAEAIVEVNGVANLTSSALYTYKIVFEASDDNGNIIYSATSFPIQHMTAAAPVTSLTVEAIPPLQGKSVFGQTAKTVAVNFYRGIANDSEKLYLVASIPFDPSAVTTVTLVDTTSDALSTQQRTIIYTLGGEYNNDPPPPGDIVCTHRDRVFIASTDTPHIYYSKTLSAYASPQGWSYQQRIPVPQGRVTGMASLDAFLVVLTTQGVYVLEGDGPGLTGQPATAFASLTPVSSQVGCTDPRGVVVDETGVWFVAERGFYLLTRNLQLVYRGADVEDTFSQFPNVQSAEYLRNASLLRWVSLSDSEARIFEWNSFTEQWSIHRPTLPDIPRCAAVTGVGAPGEAYYLGAGAVSYLNAGYLDAGLPYGMTLESGWFRFGNLTSFKRIWRLMLVGRWQDAHGIRVSFAYNEQDAYLYSETFTELEIAALAVDEKVRCHLRRQKCNSLRAKVEVLPPPGGSIGPILRGIGLEMGMKTGLTKLGSVATR